MESNSLFWNLADEEADRRGMDVHTPQLLLTTVNPLEQGKCTEMKGEDVGDEGDGVTSSAQGRNRFHEFWWL